MNILVLTPYLYDTVPGQRFRIEQWSRVLSRTGVNFRFVPFESPQLEEVYHSQRHHVRKAKELLYCTSQRLKELLHLMAQEHWDLLFLYRELLPIGPPILEQWLARRGIPLIYDFDDAIFFPEASDANRRFVWLKWPQKIGTICRLSTHVTVGNDYLREYVLRYTPRVSVIPTTIDTELYLPKPSIEMGAVPVIGWSGSFTTLKHLKTALPMLKILRRQLPFRLKVIGSDLFSVPGLEVECRPWRAGTEVSDIQSFDIGIMPLPDDAWSPGKCGLKALQYMALGVPTIASPVGVNAQIVQDGINGFIASSPEEWVHKILQLVSNQRLRERFAREGRRTVEERYSAKAQAPRFLEVLEKTRRRSSPSAAAQTVAQTPQKKAASPQDILCFSSIDWDFVWQGHQEIMSTLASQGHRVLFIENTGVRNPGLGDFPRIRRRLANWRRGLQGFRESRENLYTFSPLVLPFPYSRLARWVNRLLIVSSLKRWMEVMNFNPPVCWVFLPTPLTLEIIDAIPHKVLIYYCIDSFADSTPAAQRIVASEQALFKRADLVFVTSHPLFEEASRFSSRVHLFPFGVSFTLFERAGLQADGVPEELKGLRRPIIGYIGGIHQWIDQELFCQVARTLQDSSFVLVGPVQTDTERLRREPNVLFVGQKLHEVLPHYVRCFDVGIIPYRLTGYTRNVYPTKLNEYHVMGKPVVSTPLPEVVNFNRRFDGLVGIAFAAEEFSARIKEALHSDTPELRRKRIDSAKENSWGGRIHEMQELIQQMILQKETRKNDWAERFSASLRFSRRLLAGVLALALGAVLLFKTPLVWVLAKPLIVQATPQAADCIVVFAGGAGESGQVGQDYQQRVKRAAELFHQGYAPKILYVSGFTWTFQEADVMKALTQSLGIPAEAILTEKQVHNTYDYVLRVTEAAHAYQWKSILLVTSPYHSRRTDLLFAKNAPELKVFHQPLMDSDFYAMEGTVRIRQVEGILHEVLAIVYYRLKGWL